MVGKGNGTVRAQNQGERSKTSRSPRLKEIQHKTGKTTVNKTQNDSESQTIIFNAIISKS